MYEEKTNNFSIRNVMIQFLFVALFIFILIWLFPMKSDLKNAINGINKENNVAVFYDQIFNNNVVAMKDAAKSYYTTERLPKTVGETVKMTLGEMLNQKIILPFVDRDGEQCDLVDSYVEVAKHENEFVMKVNLKCAEQENYLLVYMGCYDYCQTAICEKQTSDVKQPVVYPTKPVETKPVVNNTTINNVTNNNTTINNNVTNNNVVINPPVKPVEPDKPDKPTDPEDPKDPEKEYEWEYVKKIDNSHWEESDWSEYSTTPVQADQYTAVRTKTTKQKVLVGYNVTTATDKSKPIYSTEVKTIGTETILTCNKYDYVSTGETATGDQWVYVGTQTFYEKPNQAGYKYEFVRFVDESCPNNCTSTVGRIYKVWKLSTKNLSEYKCVEPVYQTIPLTTEVKKITGYETTTTKTPVYETKEVKTYSYKKRKYVTSIKEDKKWSTYNDTKLLNDKYEYSGQKREK